MVYCHYGVITGLSDNGHYQTENVVVLSGFMLSQLLYHAENIVYTSHVQKAELFWHLWR